MDTRVIWLFIATILSVRCCSALSNIPGSLFLIKHQPSPDRYNYFDAELLEVLCRGERGNVVMSPLSIKLALGMLKEGAGGESAEEIEAALRLSSSDNALQQELHQKLLSIEHATQPESFRISSRVFVSDKFSINLDYKSLLMKNYGSDIVHVRFNYPKETAKLLNSWVTNATSGKITRITDESQIRNNAKLILASSIYFKGKWNTPFAAEKTAKGCFYSKPRQCNQVPIMTNTGSYEFGYIAKLDAYTINLPYEGGRFSMVLVLPKKRNGHIQLSRDMLHVSLDDIMSFMARQEVTVEIPRFAAEFNKDLVADLKKLHISHVFGNRANISGISEERNKLSISNIFHSAKIEVDEGGTVAAGSTGVLFVPLMGGTTSSFIADHPFLFFIRDTSTGTVLFSGKIEEPQDQGESFLSPFSLVNRQQDENDSPINPRRNGYSYQSIPDGTSEQSAWGQRPLWGQEHIVGQYSIQEQESLQGQHSIQKQESLQGQHSIQKQESLQGQHAVHGQQPFLGQQQEPILGQQKQSSLGEQLAQEQQSFQKKIAFQRQTPLSRRPIHQIHLNWLQKLNQMQHNTQPGYQEPIRFYNSDNEWDRKYQFN